MTAALRSQRATAGRPYTPIRIRSAPARPWSLRALEACGSSSARRPEVVERLDRRVLDGQRLVAVCGRLEGGDGVAPLRVPEAGRRGGADPGVLLAPERLHEVLVGLLAADV